MSWFLKNHTYLIGMDLGDDALKVAQLGNSGKGINLIAGDSETRPEYIECNSGNWQRWGIEAIKKLMTNGNFCGRDVVATMPASEVFIDHIRLPKVDNDKLQDAIFSKIKKKLPFELNDAMIKHIPTEEDNAMVIATERKKVDRHLAIYEEANLHIKSLAIWPVALTNSYVEFFGRRKTDIETVVMLFDIETNCTNVVICRHKNLLFARSIPIGTKQLNTEKIITRLVLELTACRQHFSSMYRKAQIERLIFLSGQGADKDIYTAIAKQLEMPAQMGDCLAAVKITDPCGLGIDRRGCQFSWATAFGLSLS